MNNILGKKFETQRNIKYDTPTIDENQRVKEIPLPSEGKVYSKDSYLADGTIKFRYMKGRDEDMFSNPDYAKKGTTLNMLLKHLCVDKEFEPNDLTVSDWLYAIVAVRIMNLGQEVMVKDIICPKCGEKNPKHTFELSNIKEGEPIEDPKVKHNNRYELKLPVSGESIAIKILDGHDMRNFTDILGKMNDKTDRLYTLTTALSIIEAPVENSEQLGELLDYVDNLPIRDMKYIRSTLNEISGVVSANIDYECPTCENVVDYTVPTDETFFFPEL
jgi:hypothetical protein